ncbi:MAG: hypothetical protein C0506_05840 [Anaerolinea sp.]|nr:hypothetical protein [Anaerolinea sp.]
MPAVEPRSKADLLRFIDERWKGLQALVSELTPEQMEQPLGDGWSAKVHLGHIAGWEQSLLALLRGQDRESAMGVTLQPREPHDLDALNDALARRSAALPFDAVREESRRVHAEVVAVLEAMSEDDLLKPYSHYQPQAEPPERKPVYGWVNGNTWGHYDEHIGWLRTGLGHQPPPRQALS